MFNLLEGFFMSLGNVDKLANFYFENADILAEIKGRYPDWESYINKYLPNEVQEQLRNRGVPL